MYSLNNRFILEVYKKEALKANISGGIARMDHKVGLKPLKLLVDAKLNDGTVIPKGSTAFIREEYLFANTGTGRTGGVNIPSFTNAEIGSEFIIIDLLQVEAIEVLKEAGSVQLY